MNKISLKSSLPFIAALVIFLVISFAYFPAYLEGKTLQQSDVRWWEGMSKELNDYRAKTGEFTLWTNSMFCGMPTYLISFPPSPNLLSRLHYLLNLFHARPVSFLFLYLLSFYIALLAFRVNPWLSIAGAIAFAFSSYFIVLIEAGHITKVQATGYMAPIVAGVFLAFRGKLLPGAVITGLFLSLQLVVNHLQITYYTLLIILVLGIIELVAAVREGRIILFGKTVGVLVLTVFLAIGSNMVNFLLTYEYSKYSTRSRSELTQNLENTTTGLDKDYITAWSYGIDETLTLLIPNFKGGASYGPLPEKSGTYELYRQAQGEKTARQIIQTQPLYWGTQPFTGGPVYVGAVIFFLFILAMFLLKGAVKWWLLITTLLAVFLSWGHNFMLLTDLFIKYFPGYNKFRDVTTILVIVQVTMPLAAILVLHKFFRGEFSRKELFKYGKLSLYIVGGIALFFTLFPGMFYDFSAQGDVNYSSQGAQVLVDAWQADREMLLRNDSLRSLIFVLLTALLLYFSYTSKIKHSGSILLLSLLILCDMWPVAKRYLNNKDFVSKRQKKEAFQPYQADLQIMADPDLYYRVLDVTADPFRSSRASFFHKSLGGYHGAKMKRYQELIDYHLSKNRMNVINMLNTKYFIVPSNESPPVAQRNPNALGNVWFVNELRWVQNADQEIKALEDFNPAIEAIVDERFRDLVGEFLISDDSLSSIELTVYKPGQLTYRCETTSDHLAVFSDIYYDKGWNAYVDGELHPHFRVNYVLRGMIVPQGNHEIEFKFEPKSYAVGKRISLISSLMLILLTLSVLAIEIKRKGKIDTDAG